ncbi:MAG TPA: hypothetical protein VGQ37_12350 [Vicinamibacterales bacterium]|jgi:hypothetical protein|nr:hypothetical protein [Vicinamibacterales bacterium]
MKSPVRALVVAFALLLPPASNASDLQLIVYEPSLVFGPAGASFGQIYDFQTLLIDGIDQEISSFFSGHVTFETGPLLSLEVFDSDPDFFRPSSNYVFGGGTFTLTAHWFDEFFTPMEGHYVAPLIELRIYIWCEQELWTQDCGDSGGGHHSLGDASVSVGPGLFDEALAHALHLKRQGGAFDFEVPLDGVEGDPSSQFRGAGSNNGALGISIPVDVPEPSILSLLLIAPIVGRRFRR